MAENDVLNLCIYDKILYKKTGDIYFVVNIAVGAGELKGQKIVLYQSLKNRGIYARLASNFENFELVEKRRKQMVVE